MQVNIFDILMRDFSTKKREMRAVCISSSSTNWMLFSNSVEAPTVELVSEILLSTNSSPK